MKYYMVFVKHISDGTEARECFGMTDVISAKATMYKKAGSAMEDPNCDYAFGIVLNPLGQAVVPAVSFQRPAPVVEETPETVE